MRTFRGLALSALAATLVAAPGCETDQPLLIDQQTALVAFQSINAGTPQYNVFDMYEDSNSDGIPDGDTFLWCELVTFPRPQDPNLSALGAPWYYSLEIAVIRAGRSTRVPITTQQALLTTGNLTAYDTATSFFDTRPKNPITIDDGGVLRRFVFENPRKHTALNQDVLRADSNPLSGIDPITYEFQKGLCSLGYPGDPNTDDQGLSYELIMNKGDTVIVSARRGDIPPELIFTPGPGQQAIFSAEPRINVNMSLDGVTLPVGASTGIAVGSPLSITFTTR